MKITDQQIKHLASLSRLDLDKEEIKAYQKDLSGIVEFVSKLEDMKVGKHGQGVRVGQDVLRKDVVTTKSLQDLVKLATNSKGKFFKVKNVK